MLERLADPNALVKLGVKRLAALIAKASHNHQGPSGPASGSTPPRPRSSSTAVTRRSPSLDLAAEVATEVRLLRAVQAELAAHAHRARGRLSLGRPRRPSPAPCRAGRGRRPGPRRLHGRSVPLCHGQGSSAPSPASSPKASETGRDRPQGPGHVQGRFVAAAHHAGARRRHCPQARPPAGPSLLRPDGRAGQGPPRRALRRRRPPGRAGLGGDGARHALRHLRHRRPSRSPAEEAKAIIAEHFTVPDRGAGPPALQEGGGKAPKNVLSGQSTPRARGGGTRGDLPPEASSALAS